MTKEIENNGINDGGYTTLYDDGTVDFGMSYDAPFQVNVETMRKIVNAFDAYKNRDTTKNLKEVS